MKKVFCSPFFTRARPFRPSVPVCANHTFPFKNGQESKVFDPRSSIGKDSKCPFYVQSLADTCYCLRHSRRTFNFQGQKSCSSLILAREEALDRSLQTPLPLFALAPGANVRCQNRSQLMLLVLKIWGNDARPVPNFFLSFWLANRPTPTLLGSWLSLRGEKSFSLRCQ